MNIGIATCKDIPDFTESDKIVNEVFRSKNIDVTPLIWTDKTIDWKKYDYIIIRSIWDYYLNISEFYKWLNLLEQLNVKVFNSIDTVKYNSHKFYLKNHFEKGIKIIPTKFIKKSDNFKLDFPENQLSEKYIIKLAVSACSFSTEVFDLSQKSEIQNKYSEFAKNNDILVQKFIPEITTGEISLVYFNKNYSHSIIKQPVEGDFRVQYQYGGKYRKYEPTKKMFAEAEKILALYPEKLLFARIDGVLSNEEFYIMEVELIEPDLYFLFDENAKYRFVDAFLSSI